MKEKLLEEVQGLIRDTFDEPNASISRDTIAMDIPGWDSLSHTVLMCRIEDHFNILLPPDITYKDVGELVDCISRLKG